jgi:hypothetical protein
MDAATAAAMSDPLRNPSFNRRWQDNSDTSSRTRAPVPNPDEALELTGRALQEQWRCGRLQNGKVSS